ncbi:MBL fold metallo-hydrolase [Sinorhizobium sp. GL28]|uniref:MBL fold metallo-hydrolase n=1 Tax=Sinorhizobium sp. GL28 TaxID=1358418 RepID=UPI00071E6613|nr:MBL fold metallo-hydrolase [Sinorhizobium sp. GL28]
MNSSTPWFERREVASGVHLVTEPHVHPFFRANLYHVKGTDADLVIDFGTGLRSLRGFLEIEMGKPVVALATHVHIDHVGSFHEFERRIGPEVEAASFETMPDQVTLAGYFRQHREAVSRLPCPYWSQKDYEITPAPLTEVVSEGSVVGIGDRKFEVLHLPGHSPGSVGLLDHADGVFFSGDAIYDGGLVDDLPGCDIEAYRRTMSRLETLEVSIAYGGHGSPMSREKMNEIAAQYLARGL